MKTPKKKSPFINKDGTIVDLEEADSWIQKNVTWLTEWLTNVVIMSQKGMDKSTATFQLFQVPVSAPPPFGIIDAGNALKVLMINQSVFGRMSLNPPKFPGFFQKAGRLPRKGDTILYTAIKWFQLELISPSNIILPEGSSIPKVPILTTICAVNYIAQK